MKRLIAILFLFPMLPLFADWGAYNLTPVSSSPSSIEGAVKYELRDEKGRVFFIHSPSEPDKSVMTRILRHRDEFYSWKHAAIKELSFYTYGRGIQAVVVPASLTYKNADLKSCLPSGFTFVERGDGIDYRYRIIVNNTSLKLDGAYSGEEPMLNELYAYVHGIRQGTIIVEDEKVVSGSVVAFSDEKEKGNRQVHPVGDLANLDKREQPAPPPPARPEALVTLLAAHAGVFFPLGHFGEMAGPGFGGGVSYGKGGLLFKGVEAGLEASCYYLSGKDSMDENNQKSDHAFFVPFTMYGGYRFNLPWRFSLYPHLSAGLAYYTMSYTARDKTTFAVTEKTAEDTDPVVSAGMSVAYKLSDSFHIHLRCSYGYLIGAEDGSYVVADLGLLYRH